MVSTSLTIFKLRVPLKWGGRSLRLPHFPLVFFLSLVAACDETKPVAELDLPVASQPVKTAKAPGQRGAWFGETHVHTGFSFDAFVFNVRTTPDDAYRYARGEAIDHTSGESIQASRPIDFMAVTDHAEYLGMLPRMTDAADPLSELELAKELVSGDKAVSDALFARIATSLYDELPIEALRPKEVAKTNWQRMVDAAERHYEPGVFTTFVGYEWTSIPDSINLHRNVIFRGGRDNVPELPFGALDSSKPENLWKYMEKVREDGVQVLAIPHNANLSNGLMFPTVRDSFGNEIDSSYAELRNRNEPLVEMSQIKGTSETHPALSPNDEFAGFEIVNGIIGKPGAKSRPQGSYVRRAYLDGLKLDEDKGFNPYKFGMIGASDSHNASVQSEEDNYTGKVGISDDTALRRRTAETGGLISRQYSASGLAGIWAEENTRESLFDAMVRKEVFATSGARIKVRLFAGWNYPDDIFSNPDWSEKGYESGVPMGSEMNPFPGGSEVPTLLVWAQKDLDGAPLQRVQIVKGWMSEGAPREQIYDVACAEGKVVDEVTHRCPANAAQVDLSNCEISPNQSDPSLAAVWRDPDFQLDQRAFYYVRAIENPTCRWSTWDAVRNDWPLLEDLPATIQERAWSSPIWYNVNAE